jgi:N-carbamoyl-L-amino-acid hydrolase
MPAIPTQHLARCIDETWALMEDIGRRTADPAPGITRPAYGQQEQLAMDAVSDWATAQGLTVERDGFGNHHILLPGTQDGPAIAAGSHTDSVPNGGNYDGLAGVMAAVAVLAAVKAAGTRTRRPLRAILMRGEESPWFGTAYLGSRLLLGRSPFAEIGALIRSDTGRSLADHLIELGYQPGVQPVLDATNLAAYFELHIEQGPFLIERDLQVAVATACRGNIRFPQAKCFGSYAHSAATPRAYRHDAVLAVAMLRATADTLAAARRVLMDTIARLQRERGVRFELGGEVGTAPLPMDAGLMHLLEESAAAAGITSIRLPTVGHDAAMFLQAGIPAAMLLVRNAHGSHNPDEAMDQADYAAGVAVLAGAMLRAAA